MPAREQGGHELTGAIIGFGSHDGGEIFGRNGGTHHLGREEAKTM